ARAIAGPLAQRLQATVIVENKAGAAGTIGADAVAKSPHDGSVLLLTSSTFLTAAATQARLPYDPIAAFAPVAMVGEGPLLLAVSASTPFKSPELAVVLGPYGILPSAMSPAAFAARVKDELAKWKQLAGAHKIVTE